MRRLIETKAEMRQLEHGEQVPALDHFLALVR
jgi:hypothetical protein